MAATATFSRPPSRLLSEQPTSELPSLARAIVPPVPVPDAVPPPVAPVMQHPAAVTQVQLPWLCPLY